MSYITSIRQRLQLLTLPDKAISLKPLLESWFLGQVNQDLLTLSLPCLTPITSFSRMRYVCEDIGCSTLAKYRLSNAGLGNRAPRPGRPRCTRCPLCLGTLDEVHVAFLCPSMNDYREGNTDIPVFISLCRTMGIFPSVSYRMYVRGLDCYGSAVTTSMYLKRGRTLQRLTTEWLLRS